MSEERKQNEWIQITNTQYESDERIKKTAKALTEMVGDQVTIIDISNPAEKTRCANQNVLSISLKAVNAYLPFKTIQKIVSLIEFTFKAIAFLRKSPPTIIHCHDVFVLPTGILCKMFWRTKVIYDAHELESLKTGQSRIESFAIRLIEKMAWRKVDCLITVSDSIRDWYSKNIGAKDSVVIRNCAQFPGHQSMEKSTSPNRTLRQILGIVDNSPIVVFGGNLCIGRYIEQTLNIFLLEQPNAHLVFIGHGPLECLVLKAIRKNRKVHYVSHRNHEEYLALLSTADVGLCLIQTLSKSSKYCLPNKLFDYIAAGIPVLSSDQIEIKNIITKYNLGKSISLGSDNLIQTLNAILATKWTNNNARLELSWQNESEKLKNLYRKMQ